MRRLYQARFADGATLGIVSRLADQIRGRRIPPTAAPLIPARGHVFLLGFPRSGTTLIEQVLEQHPDIVTSAEKEHLADGSRDWLGTEARFAAFLAAPDAALEPYRDSYWRRVRAEGLDPDGRVFVDKHPFNSFRLPLIARLFPEAKILIARRDPRDVVLSCWRHRFAISAPVYEMLTLEGIAALYDAAMSLADASQAAFEIAMRPVALEKVVADFDGEVRGLCEFIGIGWDEGMRDFAAHVGARGVFTPSGPQLAKGLNASGIGKWRAYAAELAPVLPLLAPWIARFGAPPGETAAAAR